MTTLLVFAFSKISNVFELNSATFSSAGDIPFYFTQDWIFFWCNKELDDSSEDNATATPLLSGSSDYREWLYAMKPDGTQLHSLHQTNSDEIKY